MQARDIMTTNVATVSPGTPVAEIARSMLKRGISAVPVVEDDGKVVGIVSEGDLIRRLRPDGASHGSWWLGLLAAPEERADTFIREHGRTARDVMSEKVTTVEETAAVAKIAETLEGKHIKRVPVLRDGKLVGIVSRADLLRGIASGGEVAAGKGPGCDRVLRDRIQDRIAATGIARSGFMQVVVSNGVAHLWGLTGSDTEREAVCLAAEEIVGAGKVEDHMTEMPVEAFYNY